MLHDEPRAWAALAISRRNTSQVTVRASSLYCRWPMTRGSNFCEHLIILINREAEYIQLSNEIWV